MLEIEVKAKSTPKISSKIKRMGAFKKKEHQKDVYFQHPCRNFRKTDEALRVREAGGKLTLTYKGPKAAGNLKVRREIESPVSRSILEILEAIGFKKTLKVEKNREYYSINGLEVALDQVKGLGRFVEIETKRKTDEKKIVDLTRELGIPPESCTTKSYTELLNEKNTPR